MFLMWTCQEYFLSLEAISIPLSIASKRNFTALFISFVFVSHLVFPEPQDWLCCLSSLSLPVFFSDSGVTSGFVYLPFKNMFLSSYEMVWKYQKVNNNWHTFLLFFFSLWWTDEVKIPQPFPLTFLVIISSHACFLPWPWSNPRFYPQILIMYWIDILPCDLKVS